MLNIKIKIYKLFVNKIYEINFRTIPGFPGGPGILGTPGTPGTEGGPRTLGTGIPGTEGTHGFEGFIIWFNKRNIVFEQLGSNFPI